MFLILNTKIFESCMLTVSSRHVSEPQVVRRLTDALSLTEGLSEVGWCLFALSVEPEVCKLLVDQGVIGSAFNLLEKLVNEQVSNYYLLNTNLT